MARRGFWFTVIVKDNERAFLVRDGRFERLLEPGKFQTFDYEASLQAEIVNVVRAEIEPEKVYMLRKLHPQVIAENFEIVQTGPTEVAIVSFDGVPKHLVLPNTTRVYWKCVTQVAVERIDTAAEMRIANQHLEKLDLSRTSVTLVEVVEQHQVGLLIVDGELRERLAPGRHAFWTVGRTVRIEKKDVIVVKDGERALLDRDGQFERLLGPGKFSELDLEGKVTVAVTNVVRQEMVAQKAFQLQQTHPELVAEHLEIVQTGPTEVAIVSFDGEPTHLVPANMTRVFWKTITKVDVERIDTGAELRIDKKHLDRIDLTRSNITTVAVVEQHEAGLLIVDGELRERLQPGRHAFWSVGRTVRVAKIDLRPQLLEVTAQEILTKDRVGIRVTLAAFYKIVDPTLAATASADVGATLYRLVQFAIREAVAARTLDDILGARDAIDQEVRAFASERAQALGAEVGEIGVKDVILPGEVRELLNKVVEAERVAKANLIRRQEETAATRSLLNTAKLMENNPLLLRLKELEALEKLVEKVGRIDLHTGSGAGGFDALLTKLYSIGRDTDVAK